MRRGPSVVGCRFGSWVVASEGSSPDSTNSRKRRTALCTCDCGNIRRVKVDYLRNGKSTSCGCSFFKHGEGHTYRTSEYNIWQSMIQRCVNPKSAQWRHYGGRGITVCDRWRHDYIAFLEDMGRRPTKRHSLDRINNDGPYSPDNCRWATEREQHQNRRDTRNITIGERTQCIAQWARELKIPVTTFRRKIKRGELGAVVR